MKEETLADKCELDKPVVGLYLGQGLFSIPLALLVEKLVSPPPFVRFPELHPESISKSSDGVNSAFETHLDFEPGCVESDRGQGVHG